MSRRVTDAPGGATLRAVLTQGQKVHRVAPPGSLVATA
jgi:hypothetical protein